MSIAINKVQEHFELKKSGDQNLINDLINIYSKLSRKYKYYLLPDSEYFFSPFNSLFSFEMESKRGSYLRSFDIVSLRDGVYPLLRFFMLNKIPSEMDPVLIIDEKLSALVPKAWREKVVLRRYYDCDLNKVNQKSENALLVISADPMSLPLDVFINEVEGLLSVIGNMDLQIYFSPLKKKGEEILISDEAWSFELLMRIKDVFSNNRISVLSWDQYNQLDFSRTSAFIINPLMFNFSDSFFFHDLKSKGARLISEKLKDENLFKVELSMKHGVCFHQDFLPEYNYEEKIVKDIWSNESHLKNESDEYKFLKLSSEEFKSWAHDVARELKNMNR